MGDIGEARRLIADVDSGCHVYSACFTCPLVRCIFDESLSKQLSRARDGFIEEWRYEGKTAREIAVRLHTSYSTVRGAIARIQAEKRDGEYIDRKPYMDVAWEKVRV